MDSEFSEEKRIKDLLNTKKDAFTIDLTKQNLYDIKLILEDLHTPKRQYVSVLNLGDNHLMELDISNVATLLTLRANKNCLRNVVLDLPALQILDLTNNSLPVIPALYKMTRLDQVYLGKNLIAKFEPDMLPHSISTLDISDNLISLTSEAYPGFVRSFQRFKFLEHFSIDKNEFTLQFTNYVSSLAKQCKTLKTINRLPITIEEIGGKSEDLDNAVSTKFTEELPKFADLCGCVENARKYPPSCQTQINTLMRYSELLEHMPEDKKLDQNFLDSNRQRDFFEQVDMLHSSQPMYRKHICIILARLCYVKGVSEGAMTQLVKFIKSSKLQSEEIQGIISEHIIRKLANIDEVNAMPIHTLDLLSKMGREVDISKTLSVVIEKFAKYITENKSADNPELHRLIVSLIASAVRNSKTNVAIIIRRITEETAEQKDKKKKVNVSTLFTAIRRLLAKPSSKGAEYSETILNDMNQYRYTLEVIVYCTRNNQEAATLFCKEFYSDFLSELETSFAEYEGLKGDSREGANIRQSILVCEIFALEIEAFSCVLTTKSKESILAVLNHPKKDIIRKVFGLVTQARVDPKVLAAICKLALMILSNEQVLINTALMEQYTKQMEDIRGLLDYLGGPRWLDFCKESSKYHHGIIKGSTPITLLEVRQNFIFDVFVSIINLISHFSSLHRRKSLPSYKVIDGVNMKLNGAGREDILFSVLKMDNDNVRLAVMECLNNVPLDQFSTIEVSTMVSLLTSFRNPTSGIIEIVLGKMLWLLSKIVLNNSEELGKEFRKAQARTAIADCLEILDKSYAQIPDDEEQYNRLYLSISCIYFLQACSKFQELGRFIAEYTELYNKILKVDENTQKVNLVYYPLPVESTALSSSIHNNLSIFVSTNTVDQYSDVCLRVLETIADILSASNVYDVAKVFPEDIDNKGGEDQDPMELMKTAMIGTIDQKNLNEEAPWIELQEARKRMSNNEFDKEELQNSINEFIRNDMIDIILNYLIGNSAHKCATDLDSYLTSFSKDKLKLMKLREDLERKVPQVKKEFSRKLKLLSGTSEEKTEEKEERKQEFTPKEIIVSTLEQEELAYVKYSHGSIIDRGISIQGEFDSKDNINNIDYKGVEKIRPFCNKKRRALILAAFMRCIYNVYAYSDTKGKNAVLKRLRDKRNMKILTQLVFTTDWLEGNVGAKYLRLCQPVLQLDPKVNYGHESLLELDEIVCSAAREILQLMFNRFKNEDKIPFTERENLLLSELASFGRCIFKQVLYLKYSEMDPFAEKKLSKAIEAKSTLIPFGLISIGTPTEDESVTFVIPPKLNTHGPDYLLSPQYICAEYTLSKLLPYKSMYTFTQMIFYFIRKLDEISNAHEIKDKITQLDHVEEARAATTWALGCYISLCKKEKYLFLEAIMKQCIFEKKYIRKSYIQQILSLAHNHLIVPAIESFIFENYLKRTGEKERVRDIYECFFGLEKSGDLKPALLVITVKAVYFFKPYIKKCQICPIDNVCWDPSPVMDPMPLSTIKCLIDMESLPIFALLVKIEEGLFSKGGEQIYLIQPDDQHAKKTIINNLIESCPINIVPDPIFKSLVFDKDGVGPLNAQIVGVSMSDIVTRGSRFSGELRIPYPYLMLVSDTTMKFYKVNYKYWTFTGVLGNTVENYTDMVVSSMTKARDDKKLTDKQIDEIMKNLLIEDKRFTFGITNLTIIREKEDKEPVLLISLPKNKMRLVLNSDFGLQSLVNTMIQILSNK